MSASLVGSEMCIRDSPRSAQGAADSFRILPPAPRPPAAAAIRARQRLHCLLYTSDAADDM
eukprot:14193199-Alexandrium_andersonii.AAC.1